MTEKRAIETLRRFTGIKKGNSFYATIGKSDGTIETGEAYRIWVTPSNGGVPVKVYNYNVPTDTLNLKVKVGKNANGKWEVLEYRDAYSESSIPNIPSHDKLHRFLPIYRDQILPLLVLPIQGELSVQVYGSVVVVSNQWSVLINQPLDLSASQPTAGARWVLLQYDNTGAVTTKDGTVVNSKELLIDNNILVGVPAPDAGNVGFCCVALYDGQTEFSYYDDFARPFSVSGGGGGSSVTNLDDLADVDVPTPSDGQVLAWDSYLGLWVAIDPPAGGVTSVNGNTGPSVTLTQDNIGDGTTYKQYSGTEKTKLAGIETSADVTDIANVGAALNGASADTPLDADKWFFYDAVDAVMKSITWANLKSLITSLYVSLSGNQTIAGVKTFSSFPVTPSSAPSTDYQVANKKYVDDSKFIPYFPSNYFFRCDAPGGVSLWTGTISGTPSGATLTVSAPTSGTEGVLVPYSVDNIAKIRIYNITRGSYGLIENYNTGTNQMTLTANVPGTWANGDSLTIVSQTVSGVYNWIDLEVENDATLLNRSAIYFYSQFVAASASNRIVTHPWETYNDALLRSLFGQVTGVPVSDGHFPVIINSNRLSIAWNAAHTIILLRVNGYQT